MAENYKHLYEQTKKMLAMYQDELIPGFRKKIEELENNQIEVRCKDCKHWLKDYPGCTDAIGRCEWANYMVGCNGYCVYGERKTE